ncbi:hypothetical protein I4U23_016095 [Adineta vaga]|nr:hypothetical protein I4U23_016095 [Adineta vaga]
MNRSTANILSLSDEILLNILSNLNNMDVLCSLIGINRTLDRLARDTRFTQCLDLTRKLTNDADDVETRFLNRFCLDIIPRIEHHIECLTLDLSSIDHVLRIGSYVQLRQLTLLYLPIGSADLPLTSCCSSHIVCLNVRVPDITVCFSLLDGHLSQLQRFILHVNRIPQTLMINTNKRILSNLKYFSLTSLHRTTAYDSLIVPFVCQMFHLEKLTLSLIVYDRNSLVDGNSLVGDILSHMLNLHTFTFNIITEGVDLSEEFLPSIGDISRPLVKRGFNLDCYTDYNMLSRGQCHIYSLPFNMDCMHIHSHRFPGGLFLSVRCLQVQDFVQPFLFEFFLRISQSFPLLEKLVVFNPNPQKTAAEGGQDQNILVAYFRHLVELDIRGSYVDYVKLFLFNDSVYLPSLHTLHVKYEHLVMATDNFTNTTARVNCDNLRNLIFDLRPMIYSENFFLYFPSL